MAPSLKCLCACGCALQVTRKVELGHLNGQRSALLVASVLSQNHSLLCSCKQASRAQQMSPACSAGKQELVGCPAPAHQVFLSKKASPPDRPSSENENENPSYDDFPMSKAGPSGFCHDSQSMASPHTINSQHLPPHSSPMPLPPDSDHLPPCSYPMPLLDDADGHDQYSLSMAFQSHQITERVEWIGQVCWGTNHVHFLKWEEREEDGDKVSTTEKSLNMEDEEDGMGCDHDESDEPGDIEDMPFAEPCQEGISVWDLLGEGFMKEVAEIGWQLF
jgi:hypothetical protein